LTRSRRAFTPDSGNPRIARRYLDYATEKTTTFAWIEI
jgi:hypothetical protein